MTAMPKNLEDPLCLGDELSTPATSGSTSTSHVKAKTAVKNPVLQKLSKKSIPSTRVQVHGNIEEDNNRPIKKMKQECLHETMQEKMDKSGEDTPDFEKMRVKDLKDYIQQRGVPFSKYKKPDLTVLAKSLHEMSASIDPDYREDSIEHCLNECLTLPA